jgi:hypothetical protein
MKIIEQLLKNGGPAPTEGMDVLRDQGENMMPPHLPIPPIIIGLIAIVVLVILIVSIRRHKRKTKAQNTHKPNNTIIINTPVQKGNNEVNSIIPNQPSMQSAKSDKDTFIIKRTTEADSARITYMESNEKQFCPHCGNECEKIGKYCSSCGAQFNN